MLKSVFLKLRTNLWSNRLAVKTTFFTLHLSNLNPEDEVSSSKIDWLMTNYILRLKWALRAQCLSHILVILKNNVFFEDKQMILQSLFDTSTGFRFLKNLKSSAVQVIQWFMDRSTKLICNFSIFHQRWWEFYLW